MVSAEEYRFACQLIAQHRLERTLAASTKLPTGVQIIPDLSTAAAIGIVGMHPAISVDAWRFGYVESFYQLDDLTKYPGTTACDLTGIGSPAAWLAGNRPRGLDNSRARDPFDMRRPLNGLVSYRNAVPFHLSDLLHTPDLIDHSSNRIVTVNRLSSRLPSYSQNYAFGIRRLDGSNRSLPRANAYGGPWYLPGASTNYR